MGAFAGLTFFCAPCWGLPSAAPLTAGAAAVAEGMEAFLVAGAGEAATLCGGVFEMPEAIGWLAGWTGAALGWAAEVPGSVCKRCSSASICAMASSRADMLHECEENEAIPVLMTVRRHCSSCKELWSIYHFTCDAPAAPHLRQNHSLHRSFQRLSVAVISHHGAAGSGCCAQRNARQHHQNKGPWPSFRGDRRSERRKQRFENTGVFLWACSLLGIVLHHTEDADAAFTPTHPITRVRDVKRTGVIARVDVHLCGVVVLWAMRQRAPNHCGIMSWLIN